MKDLLQGIRLSPRSSWMPFLWVLFVGMASWPAQSAGAADKTVLSLQALD